MEIATGVSIDGERLAAICAAQGIRRLAVFGSALHGRLRADSDLDLLVEFMPGRTPGLLRIAQLELDLADLVGRPVEVRTVADLSRYFRDRVAAEARTIYDAA